jgi:molybdopterin-guanine dinucleotide biosynthesis protein A
MGRDKGSLRLGDESLRMRAARVLSGHCAQVFVACRPDQVAGLESGLHPLCDETPDQGPLAGIVSAFAYRPDAAWLTLPCDMPGVDGATLALLVQARQAGQAAVAFRRADGQGPEPLVALWEPVMATTVAEAMGRGDRSPRALLQSASCGLVQPPDADRFRNLNTPEDWQAWGGRVPER